MINASGYSPVGEHAVNDRHDESTFLARHEGSSWMSRRFHLSLVHSRVIESGDFILLSTSASRLRESLSIC